ncbi:MAG TPA: sugar transferase [Thermoanaerobaculia bacterium]|nr:sugar transferase [Thermoanaerobaculia bacterium]
MTLKGSLPRALRFARLAGDVAVGPIAFLLAFLVRLYIPVPLTRSLLPLDRLAFYAEHWTAVVVTQIVVLYVFALYDPPQPAARTELLRRLVTATSLQGLILMGYYFLGRAVFPRSVVLLFVPLNCALLFGWRLLFWRLHPPRRRRVAIVGDGPGAASMAQSLRGPGRHGLELVGFIATPSAGWAEAVGARPGAAAEASGSTKHPQQALTPVLGNVDDVPRLVSSGAIDDVILASETSPWQSRLIDALARAAPASTNVWLLPGPFESLIAGTRYSWVDDHPLIEVARDVEWRINWPLKRMFDVVVGGLLLVLLLPVLLAGTIAVLLGSGRPIFYRQVRLGREGKPFTIWKLRTMRAGAEDTTGETLATSADPRVTPVGRWLRRHRIDEIPQLWNVLHGSMSLVGPRPERPGFADAFSNGVAGYSHRYVVRPGVTGLAQVHGDYHSSPETKVRYDLAYIANWSLWLDLTILMRTVKVILTSPSV